MDSLKEAEIREVFREFDKNGDGRITRQELEVALLQLGEKASNSKIETMIEQADLDGNGCIDIDEFLNVLRRQICDPKEERELRDVFNVFDKNGDGVISIDDLIFVMCQLGEKLTETEAKEMIKQGDLDHDGMIDFQEFVNIIKGQ
ncbi:EF-hand domain-containing protein [Caenorhabditis elegans]|uniref:EF-hand domain-containing protein n=1 Tax=Caenorhabditis elegans TaxID=6239 RepID=Q09980_CAEEL|nr:EF-hand domain-containing protein [Caenorhabditis elegans]CCD69292.1 EF-hand domain-containing protein [Caenorhabditis elegans]|eukprot:NP_495043.1 CALmodulin related genes [Caenorhabditis elegans]